MGSPRDKLAARPRASSATTASWAARPTSTIPTSSTTTTTSSRRARRRRATTSPRTWPTRRSSSCKDLRATAPDKPFFLWFTPGRVPRAAPGAGRLHRARTAATSTRAGTAGARRCSRARSSPGCCRRARELSERPSWVPAWDSLSADEQRLYARMMEVFAGFLTHTDAQVARVLDFIDRARRARQHDRAAS